jgi:hypothetical protein
MILRIGFKNKHPHKVHLLNDDIECEGKPEFKEDRIDA